MKYDRLMKRIIDTKLTFFSVHSLHFYKRIFKNKITNAKKK